MELKLIQHGAGQEVGRSCIEVVFPDKTRLLLDAGSKFVSGGVLYPNLPNKIKEIDTVLISHSHADHVCALPYFCYKGLNCPVITNSITKACTEVLLHDAYEIDKSRGQADYGYGRVIRVVDHLMRVGTFGKIGGVKYRLGPSGHIPGSSYIELRYEGKSILYTSDINYEDTLLLNGSGRLPLADVLITDSTYGYREHESRKETLEAFRQKVIEVIGRGGSILVGVFGVARAQEVMIFLDQVMDELKLETPVYLDGMARAITDIYLEHPDYINHHELAKANGRFIRIDSKSERVAALEKKQAIYVATSGTLNGGPILEFLQNMAHDQNDAVILTGYQPNGTGGQKLLEDKIIDIRQMDGTVKSVSVHADVLKYGLSAHSDLVGLGMIMSHVDPKAVIAQHGNEQAVHAVVDFAKDQGRKAYGPTNGEEIILDI